MFLSESIHWTGLVDPVAFTIFGRDIAWYGIIITLAMLSGLVAATIRAKKIGMTFDDLVEVFICAIPLAIIGARIGYVMVRPEYFPQGFDWNDFVRVIAVWDGGLTIMTGVPFGVLGAWLWSRWRKVDFVDIADVVIPVVLLSQGLGRWGNFMNQEIYGAPITNPNLQWFPMAVYIARMGGWYQATFFYEMVLDILFFVVIVILLRHLKVKGAGICLYTFSYTLIRFVLEFFRDDGKLYEVINFNQIICGVLAIISAGLLAFLIVYNIKKGNKVWYGKGGIPKELLPHIQISSKSKKESK